MSLTRKLLKELELNESAVERIIAAHVETVDALRQERDEAIARAMEMDSVTRERDEYRALSQTCQAEAAAAQEALAAYEARAEQAQLTAARRSVLAEALARGGANEQAIPLMLDAAPLSNEDWDGPALRDEGGLICRMKARYAPLFSVPQAIPTMKVTPPTQPGGALTSDDLRRMSPRDINRHWSAVKQALGR